LTSPYWFLQAPTDDTALEDAGADRRWTYRDLAQEARALAAQLRTERRELVFCFCRPDAASAIAYLGAVAAGHAVALLDETAADELKATLVELYRPRFVVRPGASPVVTDSGADDAPAVHDELKVLLSTSGSTGSPKFVRLSERNVSANAKSIVEYLGIGPGERAIASLPIHYSYGLSVLHSHLAAGATVVFTPHSVLRPEFWDHFSERRCTSFAGVPYSYAMLERIGFTDFELPTLRTMTQAGGRMAPEVIRTFHAHLAARGARLVVMYGQTEATARIAYVPPESLPEKAGTIGIPIPDGQLTVESDEGPVDAGQEGQLVYRGPNVMLGYATGPDDLALGDVMEGVLQTGDLGYVDEDGFHVITGRTKRIAKVFGLRLNLDEVEKAVQTDGPAAVVGGDDRIVIFRVGADHGTEREVARSLARMYKLNPSAFKVREVEHLPLMASGKVDYETLGTMARDA
jgi:acyl-CoA synthetase (AMP-forming)/AMP-acid ligase II